MTFWGIGEIAGVPFSSINSLSLANFPGETFCYFAYIVSTEQLNWKGQWMVGGNSRTGAHLIEKINSGQQANTNRQAKESQRCLEIGFKGV